LQVSIAVFSGAVEKLFWAKMAQPLEKNWPVRLCLYTHSWSCSTFHILYFSK